MEISCKLRISCKNTWLLREEAFEDCKERTVALLMWHVCAWKDSFVPHFYHMPDVRGSIFNIHAVLPKKPKKPSA